MNWLNKLDSRMLMKEKNSDHKKRQRRLRLLALKNTFWTQNACDSICSSAQQYEFEGIVPTLYLGQKFDLACAHKIVSFQCSF